MKAAYKNVFLVICCFLSSISMSARQYWRYMPAPTPYSTDYYLDVYFLPSNPLLGWACGQFSGSVIRTTDGGSTWRGVQIGTAGCHLEYIQFLNQNTGYCSGPCGAFKSTDGGASWTSLTLPATLGGVWGGWFRNVNEGWFVGGSVCGNNAFYRTTDGGTSWDTYLDTARTSSKMSDPLWTPDMPAGHVYAIGSGALWRSTDDGITWAVLYNTGTPSWHEELAKSGASFLIPYAGNDCNGSDASVGGMRFSGDAGRNWLVANTGRSMYGSWLNSATEGWGAGLRAGVYHTTNSGQTWTLKNCGLKGADMDDVFFSSSNVGWIAGDKGVYKLSAALRTITPASIHFTNLCPGAVSRDSFWIANFSFEETTINLNLQGAEADQFRISRAGTRITSCDSLLVVVEYVPTRIGQHQAIVVIGADRPDTVLSVSLRGSSLAPSAVPNRDTINVVVRHGTPGSASVTFASQPGSLAERIIVVEHIEGDSAISADVNLPLAIATYPTWVNFKIHVQDTGWTEAKFRVILSPCLRDTIITIRAYGISPIIKSITKANDMLKCEVSGRIKVPISNTGNADLVVADARIEGPDAASFAVIGWLDGSTTIRRTIGIMKTDTLLVEFRPLSATNVAGLVLEHDDRTTVRGKVNPWQIALAGTGERPGIRVTPLTIDAGTICVGERLEKVISINNDGPGPATVSIRTAQGIVGGAPTTPVYMRVSDGWTIRVSIVGKQPGPIVDTVIVTAEPCDTIIHVVFKAVVDGFVVSAAPSPVNFIMQKGSTQDRTVTVQQRGAASVMVESLTLSPAVDWITIVAPTNLPLTLNAAEELQVTLRAVGNELGAYIGDLVVTASSGCVVKDSVSVRAQVMTDEFDLSKDVLRLAGNCPAEPLRDTTIFTNLNPTGQITIRNIRLANAPPELTIEAPTTWPLTLAAGKSLPIVVRFLGKGAYDQTATLAIMIDNIPNEIEIPCRLLITSSELVLNRTQLDLGTIYHCQYVVTDTFFVLNAGNTTEAVTISFAGSASDLMAQPASFQLAPGESRGVLISLLPRDRSTGTISETVLVNGAICGTTLVIDVYGELIQLSFDVNPNPVDFRSRYLGTTSDTLITISGTGAFEVWSIDVTEHADQFSVTYVQGDYSTDGGPIQFRLRYTPKTEELLATEVHVNLLAECDTTIVVRVSGRGIVDRPASYPALLRIDEYEAGHGEVLNIPVYWDITVSEANLVEVSFDIMYYPVVFNFETIVNLNEAYAISWNHDDGRIQATITRPANGDSVWFAGEFFHIKGTAHRGIPDSTLLRFTNVRLTAEFPVAAETDDGMVVVRTCGPRNLVMFDNVQSAGIVNRDGQLYLETFAYQSAPVSVLTQDLGGRIAGSPIHVVVPAGRAFTALIVTDRAQGVYLFEVVTASGVLNRTVHPVVR